MDITKLPDILSFALISLSLLVNIIFAWQQFRSSKQDKQIKVEIVSENSLSLTKEILNEIKANTPLIVQQKLISLNIQNTGNKSILSSDYIEPIRITFNGPVLSSAIIEKSTSLPSLESINIDGDAITLPAIPLRHNKSITLNTLIAGNQSGITVHGSIANGQILMPEPPARSFLASW